jgi:hypothetical protein
MIIRLFLNAYELLSHHHVFGEAAATPCQS